MIWQEWNLDALPRIRTEGFIDWIIRLGRVNSRPLRDGPTSKRESPE
jgi:hypothetical protein